LPVVSAMKKSLTSTQKRGCANKSTTVAKKRKHLSVVLSAKKSPKLTDTAKKSKKLTDTQLGMDWRIAVQVEFKKQINDVTCTGINLQRVVLPLILNKKDMITFQTHHRVIPVKTGNDCCITDGFYCVCIIGNKTLDYSSRTDYHPPSTFLLGRFPDQDGIMRYVYRRKTAATRSLLLQLLLYHKALPDKDITDARLQLAAEFPACGGLQYFKDVVTRQLAFVLHAKSTGLIDLIVPSCMGIHKESDFQSVQYDLIKGNFI
jgi:hypothetical protein